MRIERVELFVLRLPLKRAYETSGSRETHQSASSRASNRRAPSAGARASHRSCRGTRARHRRPCGTRSTRSSFRRLLAAESTSRRTPSAFSGGSARPHGEGNARDGDLGPLRQTRRSLAVKGPRRHAVTGSCCGVAIGIQPSIEELLDTIRRELSAGYQRVKVKIKPGWDGSVAEAIRATFPNLPFMLDANSAYTLADAPLFKRFDATSPR